MLIYMSLIEDYKKKTVSAEEHAVRRQEMARRRKHLSDQKKEEEKVCIAVVSVSICYLSIILTSLSV